MSKNNGVTIAIIGGGFSGTMVAVHLLRQSPIREHIRIVLSEPAEAIGLGAAYSTTESKHLLNVRACNMSAFPDEPDNFRKWLQEQQPFEEWVAPTSALSDAYAPRLLYGRYVQHLLNTAIKKAADSITFEWLRHEAVRIDVEQDGGVIHLEDGSTVTADRIVLALGNLSPRDPAGRNDAMVQSFRYVRDPWSGHALADLQSEDSILLIGTGLTMVDMAITLNQRGHRGTIHAISRRGLLPQAHTPVTEIEPFVSEEKSPGTVRSFLRLVREKAEDPQNHGWRSVINSLRGATPKLWQSLSLSEKRRFLRHIQPYWEVHRHRMAPDVAQTIARMQTDGALIIRSGRIINSSEKPGGLEVLVKDRRSGNEMILNVARVINCTGPSLNPEHLRHRLLRQMLTEGLVRQDTLGLGLEVSADWRCVDAEGNPSPILYMLGTLCKGTLWETSAVPELREQAAEVASQLFSRTP